MYCSTCGAFVPAGRAACTECGTQVALPARRQQSAVPRYGSEDRRWVAEPLVGQCPRCGYHGEGLPYFSRGLHVALLVGATVVTAGMMGMGGLIYYLVRREHRACPRCGKGWGRQGEYSLVPARSAAGRAGVLAPPHQRRESAKRGGSIFLFIMAAILMIVGIVNLELAPVLVAMLAGTGGWFLHRAALEEREARRAALIASLQQPVLKLAGQRRGRLTVTEVATEMGWSLPRAEKVLESLNDGLRVDSEVTDEGVIVYEFRELLAAPDRLPDTDRLSESSG
ncbi:MAG TPA: hypothetical protein VGR27_00655 [Longimicrobiaceae bacterium]|nr:hypothetical protein [Longimicrobiaceae bacterium]